MDIDACIRIIEHDAMSSSSSSAAGSPLVETSEIDQLEEDTPPLASPEEPTVMTSLEHPKAFASPALPTGKEGDQSTAIRHYTQDLVIKRRLKH